MLQINNNASVLRFVYFTGLALLMLSLSLTGCAKRSGTKLKDSSSSSLNCSQESAACQNDQGNTLDAPDEELPGLGTDVDEDPGNIDLAPVEPIENTFNYDFSSPAGIFTAATDLVQSGSTPLYFFKREISATTEVVTAEIDLSAEILSLEPIKLHMLLNVLDLSQARQMDSGGRPAPIMARFININGEWVNLNTMDTNTPFYVHMKNNPHAILSPGNIPDRKRLNVYSGESVQKELGGGSYRVELFIGYSIGNLETGIFNFNAFKVDYE